MKKSIFIKKRKINENYKVFIIAEVGVNHNGELKKALKLIDIAADAGADSVKFQTFKAEQVVTEKGKMADYQKKNMGKIISQREMIRQFELEEKFYAPILKRCKQKNILFLSTPHGGKESVDFLESLNVCAYKIGSGDLTNYMLLKKITKTKKPMVLSTGMATLKEVKKAIKYIKNNGNNKIIVLHCTTNYPCPLNEVNLAAMHTMMNELNVLVGYSDHTTDIQTAIMGAALGMAVYECHFTLDKKLSGPDHKASADPKELMEKIKAIRKVQIIMGNKKKIPNKSEIKSIQKIVRKSIVASNKLTKGQKLKESDLEAKRPGNGLSPIFFEKLIGKKVNRNIDKDEQIKLSDIL